MHRPRGTREEVGDRVNTTATEQMLKDISKAIRKAMADIGLLCDSCNEEIASDLQIAHSELDRADAVINHAMASKKKHRRSA